MVGEFSCLQEPLTIGSFLNSLGLGKYAILFQAEEVSTLHLLYLIKETNGVLDVIFLETETVD